MGRPKGSTNKPKAGKAVGKKSKAKTASSKPKAAAAPAPQERVTGKNITGMITKSVLSDILNTDKRAKKAQGEIAGELGSKIASAVERFGTNRKALGIIRTLNRMEPEKIADFLDHFDYMLDISGIEERASSVQRLPVGEDAEEEAEEASESSDGDEQASSEDENVSRPQFRPALVN